MTYFWPLSFFFPGVNYVGMSRSTNTTAGSRALLTSISILIIQDQDHNPCHSSLTRVASPDSDPHK